MKFPIVGLGASAGGLEALAEFFENLPADSGMGFVVVTHQHPGHTSLLPELLGKRTLVPVVEAEDGVRVKQNRVYLSRPGDYLVIRDGALYHVDFEAPDGLRLPIDHFFRSLADDQTGNAVAIVLSGTGTDGTLGLKAIKGTDGMAMAQEPVSARYPAMPTSAIASGVVDYVLRPKEMPHHLVAYSKRAHIFSTRPDLPEDGLLPEPMRAMLGLLRRHCRNDFSAYKPSTVRRRIERRMKIHQIDTPQAYFCYLQDQPHELDLLFKELLFGVTSFFRDPAAFDTLAHQILPDLLKSKPDDSAFRVWVPGCSTGEEAYSIAILLTECAERLKKRFNIQIFATDLDEEAIDIARVGVYPDGIAVDVSDERLTHFFQRQDHAFRVRKDIRDMVVFAKQNLLADPPFTRLDLLSCRNVLIYLKPEAQRRLLVLFHYALHAHGLLFLGPSEGINEFDDHFISENAKWKIFSRGDNPLSHQTLAEFRLVTTGAALHPTGETANATHRLHPGMAVVFEKLLLQQFAPTSVLVSERGDISYIHGRTGEYLEPASGHPRFNVLEMAREGLRIELDSLLRQARNLGGNTVQKIVRVKKNGGFTLVHVTVSRITEPESLRGLFLVSFRPEKTPPVKETTAHARKGKPGRMSHREEELEQELQTTRTSLQRTVEELETSNEELQSANEELQSTNEELQSTNEELETSREEMQSLNEELQTVNNQLQSKIDLLSQANDDMQNLLNSTSIATIFLDRNLRVKRFTEQARLVINLISTDVNRPISDLVSNLNYDDLTKDAAEVLQTLSTKEREVKTKEGAWRLVRILPYRTTENVIDGLVLTFIDIDRTKRAELAAVRARDFERSIVATVREPMLILDDKLRVVAANTSFYRFFKLRPVEVEQKLIFELADNQWDIPALRERLEEILRADKSFEDFPVENEFQGAGHRKMLLNARQLKQDPPEPSLILVAMEDITNRNLGIDEETF